MKRTKPGLNFIYIATIFMLAVAAPGFAQAQDDEEAQATIAALQTQVAELQTQVANLATPTVSTSEQSGTPGNESSSMLVGDALSNLPKGEAGTVDVIAIGSPVRATVPLVVRNNTGADVLLDGVLGIARDDAGSLAFSGEISTFAPFVLPAGQVAIGDVYFGPSDLPAGLTFEFEPQISSVDGSNAFRQDLEVVEANRRPEGIVGIARNQTEEAVSGPFSVIGVCFDESGAIQGYYAAYAAKNELAPDETTPFDATFYGTGPCDAYLLGVVGYKGF